MIEQERLEGVLVLLGLFGPPETWQLFQPRLQGLLVSLDRDVRGDEAEESACEAEDLGGMVA